MGAQKAHRYVASCNGLRFLAGIVSSVGTALIMTLLAALFYYLVFAMYLISLVRN